MSNPGHFDPCSFGSWNSQIAPRKNEAVHWIWDGFIAWPGITLLTGASKLGKSTLVGMLLDRRREGGELLGKPVRPGTTVVVSEEDESFWARRQQRLNFGANVCFCRPEVSTFRRWSRFIDNLMNLYVKRQFELVVVDSLASFLPASENHPRSLRKALEELRFTDWFSIGVLLVHHPRGAGGRVGSAARGSAALPALTDILLDMRLPGGDPFTRRRQLFGLGRFPETPQQLLIEMNPEATDYAVLADNAEDVALFAPTLDALCDLLGRAAAPLTGEEILERWSKDITPPTPNTLWRWLTRGCERGVLIRHCDGTRNDPYRYTLAEAARAKPPAGLPSRQAGSLPHDQDVAPTAPSAGACAPQALTAPNPLPPATDIALPTEPALPHSPAGPLTPSPNLPLSALVEDAPAAPPALLQPLVPAESSAPRPGDGTAAVAQPAKTDDHPGPSTAGPLAGSGHDETQPVPEPADAPSTTLPDLPPHARWLLSIMPQTPKQRGKVG